MALTRNKIGFHVGPNGDGANMTGIGEYLRQLDAANIPFVIKSVANYGPIFEAVNLQESSGTPHVMVFRLTDTDDYTFDTPLYHHPDFINDPEGAADIHWQKTLEKIPPEFDKRVWLELTNEVDKNKCQWLGRFCTHIAKKANGLGYKVVLLGWASGEPEPIDLEHPEMLEFLRYCAANKDVCAWGAHEYSYIVTEILHEYPFKIGRFQYLFATCDKHGIGRPTTLITEWGWTLNNVPEPTKALQDIDAVAKMYAQYNNIIGAAIWYLGPGFGIADKTQKLIQPVTDYTLNTVLEQNQTQIPVLPEVGEWEQYGETMTSKINVTTTEYPKMLMDGWGDRDVKNVWYRWEVNNGSANVFTDWTEITLPDGVDLRGVQMRARTQQTVEVIVDCPPV